jgi:hypothetical protein
MSFFGGMASGAPRAMSFNSSGNRAGALASTGKYQPFTNPFFDLASTYTPPTVKALFGFCRHFHLTHGIINAINSKAAQYPITDLLLSHRDKPVVEKWDQLMNGNLNYRVHQFEFNIDYFVYGNTFISPSLPFNKVLHCGSCNAENDALKTRANWRYNSQGFWLSCPKCGQTGFAKASDHYYPRQSDFSLVRWNPELVSIFQNEATGRLDYTLDFTADFKNGIAMGRKDLVATTPQAILEAVKQQRTLVFDTQSVFHMRRPGLSGMGRWGIPLMMPVLKDAFFMQIMKKAQESVLLTHLVPQVFLFPQPATAGADPFTTTSLADWRDHIRRELARQRMDPSYYGILPFPLGHQSIGENGKSLLLMPEIQEMAQHICIGMGFPTDLIFGNGTYAGSSVNMRMLENFFLSNVHDHKRLVHWVVRHFGTLLNWPLPDVRFKAFRMADDLQRQALYLQMVQGGMMSETTMLSQTDLKLEDEAALIAAETRIKMEAMKQKSLAQAEIQGEAQVVMAKYMAKAQGAGQAAAAADMVARKSPFEALMSSAATGAGPTGYTIDAAVAALAKELERMPPDRREVYMQQLRGMSPEMEQAVLQQQGAGLPGMPGDPSQMDMDPSGGMGGPQGAPGQPAGGQPGGGAVDMRPMPEVLPPRRAGAA